MDMPPGLAGYIAAQQQAQQQSAGQLQQYGTLQQILANAEKQQREQQLRAELNNLGPNPTQEALATVAAKYAPAQDVLRTQQASLDRKSAAEAQAEQRRMALEQQATLTREREQARIESARERGATAEMLKRMQLEADERMRRFTVANRPEPAVTVTEVVDPTDSTKTIKIDARTGRKIGDAIPKSAVEKALPSGAAQKLFENQQNLRRAETAIALMEGKDVGEMKGDADATGWKGFMPDAWLQRFDPKGTDARAALADLGSLVIHERSGAAVSASEFPRLQPFIPKINDDPETVKKKLKRFAQVYRDVASETTNFYRESGYKVPDMQPTNNGAPAPSPGAPAAFKEGQTATGPKGEKIIYKNGQWVPM